jgi:hypothetical protein
MCAAVQPSVHHPSITNSLSIVTELIAWEVRRLYVSLSRDIFLLGLRAQSTGDKDFVAFGMMVGVKFPSMSIDSEPVLSRPVIHREIEGLERIFLLSSHIDASAMNATVDEIDRIVDVAKNLGSEYATGTHGQGAI